MPGFRASLKLKSAFTGWSKSRNVVIRAQQQPWTQQSLKQLFVKQFTYGLNSPSHSPQRTFHHKHAKKKLTTTSLSPRAQLGHHKHTLLTWKLMKLQVSLYHQCKLINTIELISMQTQMDFHLQTQKHSAIWSWTHVHRQWLSQVHLLLQLLLCHTTISHPLSYLTPQSWSHSHGMMKSEKELGKIFQKVMIAETLNISAGSKPLVNLVAIGSC